MIKKFRVWDKLAQRYILPDKGYQGHYWIDLNGKFCNLQNGSGGEEYVVEQFTGYTDELGKEVFEGDICNCYFSGHNGKEGIGAASCIVKFEAGGFCFSSIHNDFCVNVGGVPDRFKIIGNINQKPETLTANNSFTNEEISKIRECFDCKGLNYSEIQIEEKNCLYIHGGMWSNLKCARVSKRDDKYAIVWNYSNSLDIFHQVDIPFDKVLNILKG